MNSLNFCFYPSSLKAAVEFLKKSKADPVIGKSDEEISSMIKEASVSEFEQAFKGESIDPNKINNGVVYGSIVWRGLVCLFGCPETCNVKEELFDVSISEELSSDVKFITVEFLTILG